MTFSNLSILLLFCLIATISPAPVADHLNEVKITEEEKSNDLGGERSERSIKASVFKESEPLMKEMNNRRKKRVAKRVISQLSLTSKRSKRQAMMDELGGLGLSDGYGPEAYNKYDSIPLNEIIDELKLLESYQMRQNLLAELQNELDRMNVEDDDPYVEEEAYEIVPMIGNRDGYENNYYKSNGMDVNEEDITNALLLAQQVSQAGDDIPARKRSNLSQYILIPQSDPYADEQAAADMELDGRVRQLADQINNAIYNRKK